LAPFQQPEYPYAVTTYAYLGPVGTFTEAALRTIAQSSDSLIPFSNVTAALDAVRSGAAERALVPIENSVEGVVARTLDELAIGAPLVIYGEVTLPVTFSLMVLKGNEKNAIKKIATHPHAEAQCRTFIAKNYADVEIIVTSSTAAAAQALTKNEFDAAIAAPSAADSYNLSTRELGHYHFIIDAEGHISDERVGDALMGLRRICEDVRYLGSYPRADKVAPTTTPASADASFKEADKWLASVRAGETI